MTCHRDRALLSFYVSSCARPSELLGMTGADVDYGEQRIAVVSKGSRLREWIPASPEFFVWLALYLADGPKLAPGQPLWWTRRPPPRPLTYTAMRAVLGRANAKLGTNISLHDLRHSGALSPRP
ncbi:MAG: tyrosine-type recombinase/integrase [Acidimicrobiales bacterium]